MTRFHAGSTGGNGVFGQLEDTSTGTNPIRICIALSKPLWRLKALSSASN